MIGQQKNIQAKLAKGLLDLIILQLLENHPMHGYELITTIRKSFGVYFGASTIYPLLNSMEKKKCIESKWTTDSERPRRIYKLTVDGKATLEYTAETFNLICSTMQIGNGYAKAAIAPRQTSEKMNQSFNMSI